MSIKLKQLTSAVTISSSTCIIMIVLALAVPVMCSVSVVIDVTCVYVENVNLMTCCVRCMTSELLTSVVLVVQFV